MPTRLMHKPDEGGVAGCEFERGDVIDGDPTDFRVLHRLRNAENCHGNEGNQETRSRIAMLKKRGANAGDVMDAEFLAKFPPDGVRIRFALLAFAPRKLPEASVPLMGRPAPQQHRCARLDDTRDHPLDPLGFVLHQEVDGEEHARDAGGAS